MHGPQLTRSGRLWGALALAVIVPAGTARALRIENGQNPIQLDFTEDAAFDYHFTHGNGIIAPPTDPNYDPTSDNYLDWINRFETQLSTGPWHFDLRFDSALFVNAPQVSDLSTSRVPELFASYLENRYINNFELEKVSASYAGPHFEATLGDFYLSYGRGLVVSLRKIDALGVDTTLRGGTFTARAGGFSANVAGGVTNVVNTDPSTGAEAPDPEDPIVAGRLEYRLSQLFALGIDGAVMWQNQSTLNLTEYTPQCPVGCTTPGTPLSQIQHTPLTPLGFGSVASGIPTTDQLRAQTLNYGTTLELPNLWNHGNAYVEYVHQFQVNSNRQ